MTTHQPIQTPTRDLPFIQVRHNIEVAHRLYNLPGKCQNIHGHSMWVDLKIYAALNSTGVAGGLEFGEVKKLFRGFLDNNFDHHLLLNEDDPWASPLRQRMASTVRTGDYVPYHPLPGLMAMPGDPTTENLAKWFAEWAHEQWGRPVGVLVHETSVNAAGYSLP